MTEHFVTLFDYKFLPQGLALHASLVEHCEDFVLWILCLDSQVERKLKELSLINVRLLSLASLETSELAAVCQTRTKAEYCWTLTPWSVQWVFDAEPGVNRVTYIDADMYFFGSPNKILRDFIRSQKSVFITEHNYSPENDQSSLSGRYCVQFVSFIRDGGQVVLSWWRDRCMEWCFNRYENNLFGDQRYLEHFEEVLPGQIYSLGSDPRFQAPWNSSRFCHSDVVVYHFHGLRLMGENCCLLTDYNLPQVVLSSLYRPYLRRLREVSSLYSVDIPFQATQVNRAEQFLLWLRKKIAYKLFRLQFPPFFAVKEGASFSIW